MKLLSIIPELNLYPEEHTNKEECKGVFFRGRVSTFYNCVDGSFQFHQKLIPLKRMSCKGCEYCVPGLEFIQEDISCSEKELGFPVDMVDGGLYTTEWIKTGHDCVDGRDEYECQFVEVKE